MATAIPVKEERSLGRRLEKVVTQAVLRRRERSGRAARGASSGADHSAWHKMRERGDAGEVAVVGDQAVGANGPGGRSLHGVREPEP
ncbi:MAG: hypothetical protein PHO89_10365 [Methylacidiphilaceae bacterium]|nr:hypothetical protein [Candidatus Methylacidiphilaceae bacterium]